MPVTGFAEERKAQTGKMTRDIKLAIRNVALAYRSNLQSIHHGVPQRIRTDCEAHVDFEIPITKLNLYESGALFLALLTHPLVEDEVKFNEVYKSLCSYALLQKHVGGTEDWHAIVVRPMYVFRDRKIVERDIKTVGKRFGERMVAGRMAMPFFQQAHGIEPKKPQSVERFSVNQMAALVSVDAGQAEPSNVEKRFWRPSKPVIHLAAATVSIGQQVLREGREISMNRFLNEKELLERVLQEVLVLQPLTNHPKFSIDPAKLIRIRVV